MSSLERILLFALVGIVGFLLGRNALLGSNEPLHADGSANSNSRMVAVTGQYQLGVTLLYVIDTETRQLAVYESRGGSRSSGKLTLVAARKIDLDLRLEGYHDDSEFSYSDLSAQFRKSGWVDPSSEKPTTPEKSGANVPKGAADKGEPEKPGPEKPGAK